MAGIQGAQQAFTITQRYLNTSTYAGDPSPGTVVSTASVSGSIVQPYGGFLGGIMTLAAGNEPGSANYYSDPTYGQQLYAGDYQYVQFYANSVATAVQGQIVFWLTITAGSGGVGSLGTNNYVVTPDANTASGLPAPIAGIALTNTAKGNYWFIQTRGIAQVKFKASITKTTPSVDDLVYVDNAPSQLADVIADATSVTSPQLKLLLGKAWITAPAASTISPVFLQGCSYYPGS
jgi:hypothetical protein